MSIFRKIFSQSTFRLSFVVLFGLAFLCTQIPLFNYLGFEFAALFAVVASLVCGLLTVSMARKSGSVREALKESSTASAILLLTAFLVMAANAFFVKNCSWLQGVIFFVMLPIPAVVLLNSVALFLCSVNVRWKKTWFVLLFVLMLAHVAYATFTDARIFAFNPVIGYFPGITYDETLHIEGRLVLYRLTTLAAAAILLMGAIFFERKKKEHGGTLSGVEKVVVGALLLFVLVVYMFRNSLGLSSSEQFVRDELGGTIETEFFIISYPREKVDDARLERIVQLHGFHFERLARELRVIPRRKIKTFLYASAEQKGRLIGAARTNIAKPWLWQVHINLEDVDRSLKHELVHVLAADFGFPLLRIGLNSGLIEGLAVAIERTQYDEPLHRLAAMAMTTGQVPDLTSFFSMTGFMRAPAGVSYTLSGSFCKFLIERYGLQRFKRLYRSGNFETLYSKSLDQLLDEWKGHLETFETSAGERKKAAYLFKRPSIFGKECARVIANINTTTRTFLMQKEYASALESSAQSLSHTTSTEAIHQHAQALFRLRRYGEAVQFVEEKLADSTINHALLPLRLLLGDSYWARGNPEEATKSYEAVFSAHLSLAYDEACAMRLELLKDVEDAEQLLPYFTSEMEDSARIEFLKTVARNDDRSRLVRYLLGRELVAKQLYREALLEFESLQRIESDILEHIRQRRMGLASFRSGNYQRAKIHFWQSLNYTGNEAHMTEIDEWLQRCDWMELRLPKR